MKIIKDYDKHHKEYDENQETDLSKACTLEYAKQDGNNAVAEQAADVGVHCHLKEDIENQICQLESTNIHIHENDLTLLRNRFSLVAFCPISAVALSLKIFAT